VQATETTNTCGEGALGSTATWSFNVKLSSTISQIFWDNGHEVLSGSLDADRSFSFTSEVLMNMRTESSPSGLPACSIERSDASNGALEGATPVSGFKGTLSYSFAPSAGSSCDDLLVLPAPTFAALPCSMTYDLDATRTGD
jgi:hypothetical protein